MMPGELRVTLGLEDVSPNRFTCHGKVKTGNPCQNPIDESRRGEATMLLDQMECMDRPSTAMLGRLADLVLCNRWHRRGSRGQVNDLVRRWESALRRREPGAIALSSVSVQPPSIDRLHPALPSAASESPLLRRHSVDNSILCDTRLPKAHGTGLLPDISRLRSYVSGPDAAEQACPTCGQRTRGSSGSPPPSGSSIPETTSLASRQQSANKGAQTNPERQTSIQSASAYDTQFPTYEIPAPLLLCVADATPAQPQAHPQPQPASRYPVLLLHPRDSAQAPDRQQALSLDDSAAPARPSVSEMDPANELRHTQDLTPRPGQSITFGVPRWRELGYMGTRWLVRFILNSP